jgi:hypothetical protein
LKNGKYDLRHSKSTIKVHVYVYIKQNTLYLLHFEKNGHLTRYEMKTADVICQTKHINNFLFCIEGKYIRFHFPMCYHIKRIQNI